MPAVRAVQECCEQVYLPCILTGVSSWTMVYPSQTDDDPLTALKDGNPESCIEIDIASGGALLKASLYPAYNILNVSVLISGNGIFFGPNSDPSKCSMTQSFLMTHDSSRFIANGETCGHMCDVPRTCLIEGKEDVGSAQRWLFSCTCSRQSCNELLLALRSDSVGSRVSICEVIVEAY